jgi:hypothetical protein
MKLPSDDLIKCLVRWPVYKKLETPKNRVSQLTASGDQATRNLSLIAHSQDRPQTYLELAAAFILECEPFGSESKPMP